MDYDVERSKQASEEIRKAFREIFPLANEHDLPWATCHIKDFLRNRIKEEVSEGMFHFQAQIARVLCEVSPPKTRIVDMARIVVDEAKNWRRCQKSIREAADVKKERDELAVVLRRIGKLVGCNHTEDSDGRQKLVQCVADSIKPISAD